MHAENDARKPDACREHEYRGFEEDVCPRFERNVCRNGERAGCVTAWERRIGRHTENKRVNVGEAHTGARSSKERL
jgi:hypothetical protein